MAQLCGTSFLVGFLPSNSVRQLLNQLFYSAFKTQLITVYRLQTGTTQNTV